MSPARADDLRPFPSTNWSVVGRAGKLGGEGQGQALESLLRRYLPALRAHLLLRKRIAPDRIEDLLQGFVTDKIVEQNLIASASRGRGKFRSFLLVALGRYVIDQIRHDKARCRSPGDRISVDLEQADEVLASEAEPSEQFNLAWAREVIAEASRRMQAECEASGRPDLWEIMNGRMASSHQEGEGSAEAKGAGHSVQISGARASNLLITAKRSFARALRSVVGEYVEDERGIDEEIQDLKRALSRGGA
jgi:DNA-directed RNA polymerase specialized sigma24 family protein